MGEYAKQITGSQLVTWVILSLAAMTFWFAQQAFADLKVSITKIEVTIKTLDDRVDHLAPQVARLEAFHE